MWAPGSGTRRSQLDPELLIPDVARRERVLPRLGQGKGYIPGAILLDSEIIDGWPRQQRKVMLHPFGVLRARVREAIEAQALGFPIDARSPARALRDSRPPGRIGSGAAE